MPVIPGLCFTACYIPCTAPSSVPYPRPNQSTAGLGILLIKCYYFFFTSHFLMQFKTHDIKTQLSSETHVFLPPSLQTHPACPSGLETEQRARGDNCHRAHVGPPSTFTWDGYQERTRFLGVSGAAGVCPAAPGRAEPRSSQTEQPSAASVKMQAPPWEWPYFIPGARAVYEIIRARRMAIFVSADTLCAGHLVGNKSLTR